MFVLLLSLLMCCTVSVQSLSKIGFQGKEVTNIQNVLKRQGYYKGNVDGIYGTATKNSCLNFQKVNGLTADGIVGKETLKVLGIEDGNTTSYGGYS